MIKYHILLLLLIQVCVSNKWWFAPGGFEPAVRRVDKPTPIATTAAEEIGDSNTTNTMTTVNTTNDSEGAAAENSSDYPKPDLVVYYPDSPFAMAEASTSSSTTTHLRHTPKIKWGIGQPGYNCLFDIPTTLNDAFDLKWIFLPRPENAVYPALGLFCPPNDFTVCVMFDPIYGYVSGVQFAIKKNIFKGLTTKLDMLGFVTWNATLNGVYSEYWTTSQYYVSTDGPTAPVKDETLRENAVWIPDFVGSLMKIGTEADAIQNGFTKQGCRLTVGRYYFYKLSKTASCDEMLPWYLLFDGPTLVGTGFILIGSKPMPEGSAKDWMEATDMGLLKQALPHAPQCLISAATNPGILSTKVYFVDQPYQIGWNVKCLE